MMSAAQPQSASTPAKATHDTNNQEKIAIMQETDNPDKKDNNNKSFYSKKHFDFFSARPVPSSSPPSTPPIHLTYASCVRGGAVD